MASLLGNMMTSNYQWKKKTWENMASYLYPYAEIRAPNGIWLSSNFFQSYFTCALYICQKKKQVHLKFIYLFDPRPSCPRSSIFILCLCHNLSPFSGANFSFQFIASMIFHWSQTPYILFRTGSENTDRTFGTLV